MNQTTKKNISLLLIFKNEESNIKKNFNWVKNCPVINQIIGIDNASIDDSQKILKQLATKDLSVNIFKHDLNDNFSAQRKFGLSKSKNDWILWLDADEKPSREMLDFINHFNFPKHQAFAFKRQDIFLNHRLKHGETSKNNFTRLFNKTEGAFKRPVHEIWQTNNCVIKTGLNILHYPHFTITSLLKKINFYTDIRAQELYQDKHRTSIFQIIAYPMAKFLKNYIFLLGFLDGTAGIIFALFMSLHSFLVRAKLWQLQQS